MIENGTVSQTIESGVATITFGHPRGNSLPGALLREIASTIDNAAKDSNVRVVVLKTLGDKVFCGGASFDELLAVKTPQQSNHFFSGFAILISAMRRCPKFIVTRVQGKVVGGGVGIVAASDYVFAMSGAALRLSEFALGFGPFVIGPAVQRKIGTAAFSQIAVDAEWRDANWGVANGLYAQLFTDVAELDLAVAKFAAKLSASNPEATAKLKSVLWEGTENWDELLPQRVAITAGLALTDFVQSAVQKVNVTKG